MTSAFVSSAGTPHLKKVMIFIDGENLVARFQETCSKKDIKEKNIKERGIRWLKDKFVWKEGSIDIPTPGFTHGEIIRAMYYTCCDPSSRKQITGLISKSKIIQNYPYSLTPVIIPSESKENPKGDDIKMSIDSLLHAINNTADIIYIFTGDGDFIPLVEELQRMGKLIYIAAFSEGLHPDLKQKADHFFDLDVAYNLND